MAKTIDITFATAFTAKSVDHGIISAFIIKYYKGEVSMTISNGICYILPGEYKLAIPSRKSAVHKTSIKIEPGENGNLAATVESFRVDHAGTFFDLSPDHMLIYHADVARFGDFHKSISSKIKNTGNLPVHIRDGHIYICSTIERPVDYGEISLIISDSLHFVSYSSPNVDSIQKCVEFFNNAIE